MQLNPYLNFNGQCEEAFRLYERCLGGKLESMFRYEGSPAANMAPKEWGNKVMHAALRVAGTLLMGSDTPPDRSGKPGGFAISISVNDTGDAERIFNELSAGGTVHMPLEKTFWAERFGMFVDRFGIPWMINCEAAQQAS
jgi:PhnB protein